MNPAFKRAIRIMSKEVTALVLAAGRSTRMREAFPDLPKVLLPIDGKPMVKHLLEAIEGSDATTETVVVTGPDVDGQIRMALTSHNITYAMQPDQLGTGHAVLCSRARIPERSAHLLVLCGDHPLISSRTIRSVVQEHLEGEQPVTLLTVDLPDFDDWRSTFAHCGRIMRTADGFFERIVEAKDAEPEELVVAEVNPSIYCFRTSWLWEHLIRLTPDNAQAQYYITDVVGMATAEGDRVETVRMEDHREAASANTPEEFEIVQQKYAELNCPGEYRPCMEEEYSAYF
jgi:bifunctional UDP-N-acetylglucosamine pyrophosphorylase/glucosamine-1-phosphate N-acetyltransferase